MDWLIEKNKAGYQMVNSVQRLKEMKTFVRMSSGLDPRGRLVRRWDGPERPERRVACHSIAPGIVQTETGDLRFAEWNCRAGQNNVIIRTDGTVAPEFPDVRRDYDWGNVDSPNFDKKQLTDMKKTCREALLLHAEP